MSAGQLFSDAVIDASVWVSRLLINDSNHILALTWVNQHFANGGSLVAPALLVTETAAAMSGATRRPVRGNIAAAQLKAMPEVTLVPIDRKLIDEATTIAADLMLRGADAYYVAVAKMYGLPLVTFDKEQLTRTAIITTIHP